MTRRLQAVVFFCAIIVFNAAYGAEYSLLCSRTPAPFDGNDPTCVNLTRKSDLYIYVWPETDIKSVYFITDSNTFQTESYAPYELKGGSLFNLLGQHKVEVTVTKTDSSTVKLDPVFFTIELPQQYTVSAVLMWNPNPDAVDGYKIFYSLATDLTDFSQYNLITDKRPKSNVQLDLPNFWCDLHMKADRIQTPGFKLTAFADNWIESGNDVGYRESDPTGFISTVLDPIKDRATGEWCAPNTVSVGIR